MHNPNPSLSYLGSELEVFAAAKNWRAYWQSQVKPYLGAEVLEVGAGIGTVTASLCHDGVKRWVALEPDAEMAARLLADRGAGRLPTGCDPRLGTLGALAASELFDSALYIDVIEHIENDRDEVSRVCRHLRPGGHLIVLVPAHQSLYSAFDAAIGHFRRYTLPQLLDLTPAGMVPVRVRYLDSVGLLASLGNRLLLHEASPSRQQILLWDRLMVRASRLLDPLLGFRCGKSALVVWQKRE